MDMGASWAASSGASRPDADDGGAAGGGGWPLWSGCC